MVNLCDTSDCPRCQVLDSIIAHVRRKERKERTKGEGMSPGENTLAGTRNPASTEKKSKEGDK